MRKSPTTRSPRRRVKRFVSLFIRWFSLCCLITLGATVGFLGAVYYSVSTLVPQSLGSLDHRVSDATRIYSSDGVLLARLYQENRDVIPLEKIPEVLQQATIAVEDQRFREHYGFDHNAIIRATIANLRKRGYQQGASTLTQQLARNIYLSKKKTLARKFQELSLAIALERHYTKDQILEAYLNHVYYGSGAYGVEAAARTYFGIPAERLNLSQAALIAGLTQRPTAYSPHNNLDAAVNRRNTVLRRMVEEGYITEEEASAAREEEAKITPRPTDLRWRAPYFVSYVIQQLANEYGEDTIYQAGLRIYTTLDWKMQQAAEKAVRDGVNANKHRKVGQAALVSMDPYTGFIRAMVGGTDFRQRQFNVTTQGNPQTGSTFKIFVYAAALENGWKPTDQILDKQDYLRGRRHPLWPRNYDNVYRGNITLRTAVAWSSNVAAVRLTKAIGVGDVIRYSRAMGVTSKLPEDLTIALGTASVTPLEMVRGLSCIANGGEAVMPIGVTRVTTNDGGTLFTATPSRTRVLRESTAEGMDDMLRAVVTSGTGRFVNSRVPESRGKTGTTDENLHVWFIGYTPELVTAVWAGNDRPIPMPGTSGAGVCAPMWASFMNTAVPAQKEFISKRPELYERTFLVARQQERQREQQQVQRSESANVTLTICDDSQLVAVPECPNTHRQSFQREFAPSAKCDIHSTPESPEPTESESAPEVTPQPTQQPEIAPASQNMVNVLICADTNLMASTACPHVVRKRLPASEAPTQICGRH